MRYVDFSKLIQQALRKNPAGLTWADLKKQLQLPYDRPCPSWVKRLEREIGLSRTSGAGRALVWKLKPEHR